MLNRIFNIILLTAQFSFIVSAVTLPDLKEKSNFEAMLWHCHRILKAAYNPFDNLCILYLVVSEMERANCQTFPIQKHFSLHGDPFTFTSTSSRSEGVKEWTRGEKD